MKIRTLKRVLTTALIAGSASVAAATETAFQGFYTGVEKGGSFMSGRESVSTSGNTAIIRFNDSGNINTFSARALRKNSLAGAVFAGYGGTVWDRFYLAIEGYYKAANERTNNLDDANSAQRTGPIVRLLPTLNQDIATQVRTRLRPWELGADIRPGIFLTDTFLLFGKIGVAFNELSVKTMTTYTTAASDSFNPLVPVFALPVNAQVTENRQAFTGLRLGLGVEKEILPNLLLRSQYAYTRYRKVQTGGGNFMSNFVGAPVNSVVNSTITTSSSTKVRSHAVMMGLSYFWQ